MTTRYEIEKFNGKNFSLRKDNCLEAIEEKSDDIIDKKWKEIDNNAIANFHLALADAILSSIAEKTTAKEI